MVFVRAGPAEILRASQQDDAVLRSLRERLERIFMYLVDFPTFIKHKNLVHCLGQYLYYFNTTLSGLQTLGEEYTGIVLVDSSLRRVPTKLALWLMVILESTGPTLVDYLRKSVEKRIREKRTTADDAERAELNFFSFVLKILPLLPHLHKALFYYRSGTYHISKRIAGIHYVLVRFWLKDRQSLKGFRLLSLVSGVQLFALFAQICLEAARKAEIQESANVSVQPVDVFSSHVCVICAENISSPTATPCGHMFCWRCIVEWAQNEERCPICRETVAPNRLVPLRNYL